MTAKDSKSTPKKAERHPLALLELLLGSAESAAAARLEQMHGHLSVGHRASGYDGTAAQIHAQYAHALAPIVQALRAQAEAEAGLRELVTQLMSDPWSYHYEGSGTTTRCVGCGEKKGAAHEHWCPIPSIAAALAQAGGES